MFSIKFEPKNTEPIAGPIPICDRQSTGHLNFLSQ